MVYDGNDMAFSEAPPNGPVEDDILSFDDSVRTAIADDHFFEAQHPDEDQ